MSLCPYCKGSGRVNQVNRTKLEVVTRMLEQDRRRDIYEAGAAPGEFYVTYSNGTSPVLNRAECDKLVERGFIHEDDKIKGWFHQTPIQ